MKETTHNEGQRLSIHMKGSLLLVREIEANNLLILDVTTLSKVCAVRVLDEGNDKQYVIDCSFHTDRPSQHTQYTYSKRECDNAIAAIQQSIFNDYDFM